MSQLEKALDRFDPSRPVLEGLIPYEHQVAGHTKEILYKYKEFVLKPLVKPVLFLRELAMYETLAEDDSTNYFMFPDYYGAVEAYNEHHVKIKFIVLKDMTSICHSDYPNAIDIKIGRHTYEPSVDEEKKKREKLKYIYQEEVGFRITGLKVYNSEIKCYSETDKHFGRSLLPSQVQDGLALFFFNGKDLRKEILDATIIKLKRILDWMLIQNSYQFYCSSILIVYDSEYNTSNSSDGIEDIVDVRMIDLAHTVSAEGIPDDGYIHGLKNLIHYIEGILLNGGSEEGSLAMHARSSALLHSHYIKDKP